uniref:Uncharacterized protein n=1 Tax=Aegilops tauschii subsp. strangulata TaxID=200361 RepID=A0A453CFK9_AEGTS
MQGAEGGVAAYFHRRRESMAAAAAPRLLLPPRTPPLPARTYPLPYLAASASFASPLFQSRIDDPLDSSGRDWQVNSSPNPDTCFGICSLN